MVAKPQLLFDQTLCPLHVPVHVVAPMETDASPMGQSFLKCGT